MTYIEKHKHENIKIYFAVKWQLIKKFSKPFLAHFLEFYLFLS